MYTIVWRFTVKAARRAEFERAYGADGAWARLFGQSPDYLGTDLYRDTAQDGVYITIDRWKDAAAFDAFKAAYSSLYAALDDSCAEMTETEERLGVISPPSD
jgi:quinol monooxygenase YgiN